MRPRPSLRLTTAAAALLWGTPGLAAPPQPTVAAGSVSLSQSGNRLTVTETSPQAILNWGSFSIGSGEIVQFIQPSATATLLNRVTGGQASQINGRLLANGRLFLLNPNGIDIGAAAVVQAAGLLITSSALADQDFLAGRYRFTAVPGQGGITNAGRIAVDDGGSVLLSAPQVTNSGTISARLGGVQLGAADAFAVDPSGGGLWAYQITGSAASALIANHGTIAADGGQVALAAKALDAVQREVINTDGLIQADSVSARKGAVTLDGADGGVGVGGRITALGHGSGEDGGSIAIGGGPLRLGAGAVLDTSAGLSGNGGSISVRGQQTSVAGRLSARGGSMGGDGGVIETSGAGLTIGQAVVDPSAPKGRPGLWRIDPADLTIDATAAASAESALANGNVALVADAAGSGGQGDVSVTAPITWSAGTTLTLTAQRNININAPITASGDNAGLVLQYNQGGGGGSDITAAGAAVTLSGANPALSLCNGAKCSTPLLIRSAADLANMAAGGNYALVGAVNMSGVSGFAAVGTAAAPFSGSLDGLGNSIANLTASGPGLIGVLSGSVQNLAVVNETLTAGGTAAGLLAGSAVGGAVIANSSSSGSLSAAAYSQIGGLVGNNAGTISDSYSTAAVRGGAAVGGLVGQQSGSIQRSFALGTVQGTGSAVGGLVGLNSGGGVVDSYATGSVAGGTAVGSLIGQNQALVQSAYGAAQGVLSAIGSDSGTSSAVFTAAQITDPAQLSAAWTTGPQGTPILAGRQSFLTITAGDVSVTYGAKLPAFQSSLSDSTATVSGLSFTVDGGATPGAGSHAISPGGASAVSAIGYPVTSINYQPGTLTVTPAPLTVTANSASRVYGAANPDFTLTYTGFVNGEDAGALPSPPTATTTATAASAVGTLPITAAGPAIDGNYALTYAPGALTITPAPLTVTVNAASRVYGAADPAYSFSYAGFVNGDTASMLTTPPTASSSTTASSSPGVYPVTASGPSTNADYQVTYAGGSLTILKAPLTWSVTSTSATYGTVAQLGQATLTGLVNGDSVTATVGLVAGGNVLSPAATTPAGVYSQAVTGLVGDNGDYTLAQTGNSPGSLTINPAPLTVKARDAAKIGGQAVTFGGSAFIASGLVNGDRVSGVTLSSPGAAADAPAGGYPLHPSAADGSGLGNYDITYVDGVLTVTPSPLLQSQQVAATHAAASRLPPPDAGGRAVLPAGQILVPGLVVGTGTLLSDDDVSD